MHASDIFDRNCPGLDGSARFFRTCARPPAVCWSAIRLSSQATASIEHAFAIGFETVIFLLSTSYLHTADRRQRIHKRGRLRSRPRLGSAASRHARRGPDIRAGGKTASQSQVHSWFAFDLRHFGPATLHSASLHHPDELMPWEEPPMLRLVQQN